MADLPTSAGPRVVLRRRRIVRLRATQPADLVVVRSAGRVSCDRREVRREGDRHTISVSGAAGATVSVQLGG